MSISEEVTFDNRQRGNESTNSQRPSEPIATFTFDNRGKIVRFPLFRKLFLSLVIILVAGLAFGLGRLSVVNDEQGITIEYDPELIRNNEQPTINRSQTAAVGNAVVVPVPRSSGTQSEVVASKNSNKYHFTYCPGAKQIKEENKVTFESPLAAENAGLTLASNCKAR